MSLRKKFPYSGPLFHAFFRIRSKYGEMLRISPYSMRMRENAGKMWAGITPNTVTFYAVCITPSWTVLKIILC